MLKKPRQSWLSRKLQSSEPFLFRSRRAAVSTVLFGSVCVGSYMALPYLYPDSVVPDYQALRRNGYPVQPNPQLEHLVDKAMTDMEFSDAERDSVNIFSARSRKCEVLGSIKLPNGAIIGLPAFFNAQSQDEVLLEDLCVPHESSNKDYKSIHEELKKISVLSDNAKLFAIADAVAEARNNNYHLFQAVIASICYIGTFLQSSTFIKYTHFKGAAFIFKLPVYFISAAMWGGTWKFICGSIARRKDEDRLNYISGLGYYYLEGGIEYYDKVLISNKLINELVPFSYQENGDLLFNAEPFQVSERLLELEMKKKKPSPEVQPVKMSN